MMTKTLLSILAGLALLPPRALASKPRDGSMTVCVFYDVGRDNGYKFGQLHAIMIENLLGHFREVRTRLVAVNRYTGLDGCDRSVYMGSYYRAPLGPRFLRDLAGSRKPVLWVNYGIEALQDELGPDDFAKRTGFLFAGLTGFDEAVPKGKAPDFFRYFDYKGERFTKKAFIKPDGTVVAAPEIALLDPLTAQIAATAVHSGSGEETPYVTINKGFFYVADNPFLYAGEQDRYLIFCDLLFDFLELKPREKERHALIRLEDIHPAYNLRKFSAAVDILKKHRVPFAISLIPRFVAPEALDESKALDMANRTVFVDAVKAAMGNGGEVLLHGYTHDVTGLEHCPSMGSGADYEFWDRCRKAPLPDDNAAFAEGRVEKALVLTQASGLRVVAWVTPHYTASSVDFAVFARAFDRTVQRVRYTVGEADSADEPAVTQFFPYTIYRDHYGQFVWPENLGFVPMPDSNWGDQTPGDMLKSARLTKVVRDSWASFFWHPQLIDTPGAAQQLETLIDGIKGLGYGFVSLKALRERGE